MTLMLEISFHWEKVIFPRLVSLRRLGFVKLNGALSILEFQLIMQDFVTG